jgi:hypothetical protein
MRVIQGDDPVENFILAIMSIMIVACLVEISSINYSVFKKDIRIKVNQ